MKPATTVAEQVERQRAHLQSKAFNRGIPLHMHDGLIEYVLTGRPVGSFLELFLSNDLMGAMGHADDSNQQVFHRYCMFLYNDAPSGCYGSPQHYQAWIKAGGLMGIWAAAERAENVAD